MPVSGTADRGPVRGRDRGAGTVLVIAVIGFAGLLIAVTLVTGRAVQARHRAQAAADLAALAAAAVLEQGPADGACASAATVARLNSATLSGCDTATDGDVLITVEVGLGGGGLISVPSSDVIARAGPVGSQAS